MQETRLFPRLFSLGPIIRAVCVAPYHFGLVSKKIFCSGGQRTNFNRQAGVMVVSTLEDDKLQCFLENFLYGIWGE